MTDPPPVPPEPHPVPAPEPGLTAELLLMYELALAVGQTLDTTAMCRGVLRILMSRRNLASAAIWRQDDADGEGATPAPIALIDAMPRSRVEHDRLPPGHPIWRESRAGARVVTDADPLFAALVGDPAAGPGSCALLPLGGQGEAMTGAPQGHAPSAGPRGLMVLHSRDRDAFSPRLLAQMRAVLAKLGHAIEGSLAVHRLQREIGQRHRAEARLASTLSELEALLRSAPDILFKIDIGARLSWANDLASQVTGYTPQQLLDLPPLEHFEPEHRVQVAAAIARGFGDGQAELEVPARTADGLRQYHYRAVRVLRDGAAPELLVAGRDVTEFRRIQADLQRHRDHLEELVAERTAALLVAKEMAESALRAKTVFLANMSHELRTPLSAIIGMNELALRRASDDRQRDHLGKVGEASRHLLALIDDLLDLSRIEAGRLSLDQRPFRLNDMLDPVLHAAADRAAAKGLRLKVEVDPGVADAELVGDPARLAQVLSRLLGNAVKFTAAGQVLLRVLAPSERATEWLLRFEVVDTGDGIAAADQRRLFSAFEQADSGLARRHGGSGLGLAICKRLVQAMGGEIGVASRPGQGSTFWFRLVLRKAATPSPAPSDDAAAAEAALRALDPPLRVLLAEDEPTNQAVALAMLAAAGVRAELAVDGHAALALASSLDFDLVLMDVRMPGLDGLQAARAIRALRSSAQLPIVAMTAGAYDDDRRRCLEAGMDDYIAKPVAPQLLYFTLAKWMRRGARGPASLTR